MSGPSPTERPEAAPGERDDQTRVATLAAYFATSLERYTPEALRTSAAEGGYTAEEIGQALDLASARRERDAVVRPVRARARIIIIGAYLLTYVVFVIAFLGDGINQYSAEFLGPIVLAIVLVPALLLSLGWTKTRGGTLLMMLVVPFVLLVVISGLCVASTGPTYFGPGV